MSRVVVVGGGIVGLGIAWRLRRDDIDVTVLDSDEEGAWHVAAGMLAPGGESAHETPALVRLLERSATLWPAFAAGLGGDVGYDDTGTLSLAMTADDVAEAARTWTRRQLPLLRSSELRDLEPALFAHASRGGSGELPLMLDPEIVQRRLQQRLQLRAADHQNP